MGTVKLYVEVLLIGAIDRKIENMQVKTVVGVFSIISRR